MFVPVFLISGAAGFKEMYGLVPVEQLLFHIVMPGTGAHFGMVHKALIKIAFDSGVLFVLVAAFLSLKIVFKKTGKTVCFAFSKRIQRMGTASFAVLGLGFFIVSMGFPEYIESLNRPPSTFYEDHYIDPASVDISFPAKKRNLIVLFIESLETGFLTREKGGAFSERLMPELESLLRNNINFSADGGPGGAFELYGTEWTIAGMAAQYSGLPLALSFLNRSYWNGYGTLGDAFLPGASSLGDILHNAGYKSYFILGSDIAFAGRDKYFATHKNTVIYDHPYFRSHGYIPEAYHVWWGIEDRKLYALAKEKMTEIAAEEPFFVTLLTADTHPPEGYLDPSAVKVFGDQYKNVLFDAGRQMDSFLAWLKEQPFYENTTVVVLGDHLFQDSSFFPRDFQIHSLGSRYDSDYHKNSLEGNHRRFPVNVFINSLLSGGSVKNRIFSHFDMFPALIDSIGGVYEADGLGLGRSMDKGKPTLLETLGVDVVNTSLQQRSEYYNSLWRN
jgi:phosphoglycerol transferase